MLVVELQVEQRGFMGNETVQPRPPDGWRAGTERPDCVAQTWFMDAPHAMLAVDLSALRQALRERRDAPDLHAHLAARPEEVVRLLRLARVRGANRAALELLEVGSAEELTVKLRFSLDPSAIAALTDLLVAIEEGATRAEIELPLQTFSGADERLALNVRVAAGAGESLGTVLVCMTDVTAHKQAEARLAHMNRELHEQAALIRTVIANLPQAVLYQIEAQPDGPRHFTYLSDAVTALFGCTPQAAVADPNLIYERFAQTDIARVTEEEEVCLRTLTPFETELRFRTPAGQIGWIYAASAPRRRDDGTIIWDGLILDITERKRIEAERERLIEALRESERNRNEFLAVLSHELRGPLSPIRNSLFVIERARDDEQAQRALQVMDRQITHLCRLVDDLLDVTRISRGTIRLELERLELEAVVRQTLDDLHAGFETRGVQVRRELGGGPYWIDADRTRIAQVIGNLLSNAMELTPRGGKVEVALRREGPWVSLRVRDTGIGLAPEALAHIFQPFFQTHPSLARTAAGLGLGLALIKGLVELHGGTVSVLSDGEGQGAEFTVRLPTRPAGVVAEAASARPQGRRKRVLVIEDNPDAAHSLRDLLERMGHEVQVAPDGQAGLRAAQRLLPEVILCDVGLPGMDGYDLARAIRADKVLRDTLLVAITGHALPEDERRAREAGFTRHIAKPPSIESLESVLAPVVLKR